MPKSLARRPRIHHGSVAHCILEELERYPNDWYQWWQFPTVDAHRATIVQAVNRLVAAGLVEVEWRQVETHTEPTINGRDTKLVRVDMIRHIRHREITDA